MKPDPIAAAHANARGIGHMEQFKYVDAVKEFEEAVKLAPDWTPRRSTSASRSSTRRNPRTSTVRSKLFAEIIANDRDNAHAHYCSGIILFHQDKLPEAAKHFDEVNRIDPNDAQAWYWRGRCILDSSASEEALKLYQKALKLNPYLNAARYGIAQHEFTPQKLQPQEAVARRLRGAPPRQRDGPPRTSSTPRWAATPR